MPQSSRSTVSIRKLMYTLTFKVKYRGYPIHCQINMVICINNDYVNQSNDYITSIQKRPWHYVPGLC